MKKLINNNKFLFAIIALIAMFQTSCNEEFPNLLKDNYEDKQMGNSLNKVLVIVVDGVRGNALTDVDPENLRKIARNSLYSNSSLGDFQNGDFTKEAGLANIFTGVTASKHNVTTDLSSVNAAEYPTIFEQLKKSYDGFNSKAFTTNQALKDNLFKDVDEAEVVSTDDEVIANTKAAILSQDVEMVVAHLSDVEKVGLQSSFESDDVNYRNAILNLDNQVASLISTLESRPNYKGENWLVVITSSIGGDIQYVDPEDQTAYADHKRNTFTYFFSPRFTRKYVAKPSTNSIPFKGSGLQMSYGSSRANATSARLDDASKLNFTGTQNFTITFFFKQVGTSNHNYPVILSKRQGLDNGTGWQILRAESVVEFGGTGISKIKSHNVNDGKWHTVTISVNRSQNTAKIYTNGVLANSTTAGTSNLTNTNAFIWGRMPTDTYNTGDFIMCNLQVYDVAMSDDDVAKYAKLGLVTAENSPYYNNLLGYWPAYDDLGKNYVTDLTGKSGNLKIYNEVKWNSFSELVPHISPEIDESVFRYVPNQVDVPFFIYQWFGVLPKSDWKLEGQAWTPPYAVLEY